MAANLDRAETSLTAVSDVAYIRAIDSSGNSVRISKADLASVLGAIKISIGYDENLNDKRKAGVFYICGSSSIVATLQNKPSGLSNAFGMFVVPTPSEPTYCVQFLISEMAAIYKRKCDNNIFSEWESI